MRALFTVYRERLNSFILLGILAGLVIGLLLPFVALEASLLGDLFLRLLSMLIVPVIVLSILSGVLNLESSSSLGRLGLKTVGYYAVTTLLAVLCGLLLVNLIDPGAGGSLTPFATESADLMAGGEEKGISAVLYNLLPANVIAAAAEGNVLGLIFATFFLGVALLSLQSPTLGSFTKGVNLLFDALIWMIDKVMLTAPVGVFALVGSLVAESLEDGKLFQVGDAILWYSGTVVVGLLFHGMITLPFLLRLFHFRPVAFFGAMFPAVSTAFSTASSAATLPITIDSLKKRAGIPEREASFVTPLGATVNMDGTAIYEAVAAVFIANMYGVDLSFADQVVIFVTATFSAIGAAGIPGAGLVMMTLVLQAVNLPLEGIQLIVIVDRALDMLRTAVNVWGDSIGAAIIARSEGSLDSPARES